jgi:chemotaxis protein CheD
VNDVYLTPGGLYASAAPCTISTLLGSCVGVTLWCRRAQAGAMNHYLLPRHVGRGERSARHGDTAMTMLLARMEAYACSRHEIEARIFGGAAVLATTITSRSLGEQNVIAAWQFLRQYDIRVIDEQVGGTSARRISMDVRTGEVTVNTVGGA